MPTPTYRATIVPAPKRTLPPWQPPHRLRPPYRLPLADKPGGDSTPIIDLYVQNEGTIFLLHPVSASGHSWCEENLDQEAQRLGKAYAVEHRYISDIVDGARRDGLVLE